MEVNFPGGGDRSPQMPPFRIGAWLVPLLIIMAGLTAAGTLFYQIGPDEVGVVQRFGKYVRKTNPGLHLKIPFGVETVTPVKTTHVFKEEFGFRTVGTAGRTVFAGRDDRFPRRGNQQFRAGTGDPFLEESLMLTGDLNVAVVEWIVQYTIKDPVKFLFQIRDPRETIRNMSESVMRLVVGDNTIDQVLTAGRVGIQQEAEERLQALLDDYEAGISIRNVILQDVTPPTEVRPSFNAVNEARQQREQIINEAWREYNRVIPRARGEAEQMIRAAEGYALQRVNIAEGDAHRFLATWEAYRLAPSVTKRRLYLETLEKLLPTMQDKVIVDSLHSGVLPLLNLNPQDFPKGGKES